MLEAVHGDRFCPNRDCSVYREYFAIISVNNKHGSDFRTYYVKNYFFPCPIH